MEILVKETMRKFSRKYLEDQMNTPIHDNGEPTVDRPPRQRGGVAEQPQGAFGDVIINVEDDEGKALLKNLEIRDKNKSAASLYNKADTAIKDDMGRRGFYDQRPHNVRAAMFLITIAPSDGTETHMDFMRKPSIRTTIKKES